MKYEKITGTVVQNDANEGMVVLHLTAPGEAEHLGNESTVKGLLDHKRARSLAIQLLKAAEEAEDQVEHLKKLGRK